MKQVELYFSGPACSPDRGIKRAGGEPLAAIDVAALRVRVELARSHVFDHTLTKRTDSVGLAHRALLPESG